MSGIAGVFRLDGRAVHQADVGSMVQRLAHRGRDGSGSWAVDSLGLGHLLSHGTPESTSERLPRVWREGELAITADLRLDNRDELLRALGLRATAADPVTDSEIVLHAYERWQERTPEHLVGDFAFAIWDARRQRLFCARDIYGIRPFYYWYRGGGAFVFASEIKALLALPEIPAAPHRKRIALHLANVLEDQESTFFEGILRLPPAKWLSVSRDGVRAATYWRPGVAAELRLKSSAEYGEAFRAVFFEAVASRLRSTTSVGSLLSGGIDSSSIVGAARELLRRSDRLPLHTFSVVYRNADGDERRYLETVLAGGGVEPHIIDGDELDPTEDLERILWHTDEPHFAANLGLNYAPYKAAGARGIGVLLDGLLGDETLFHGKEYLAELLRRGRVVALWKSLRRLARHEAPTASYFLKEWAIRPNVPASLRRRLSRMRQRSSPAYSSAHLLSAELRRVTGAMSQRARAVPDDDLPSVQEAHRRAVSPTWQVSAFELADKCTQAFSVEGRYPFADRRLIEFCLSVPPEQKFHEGWTRMLARRGLAGVLPEAVRWRGSKAKPGFWVGRALLRYGRDRLENLVSDRDRLLEPYVDVNALKRTFDAYCVTERVDYAGQLWRALQLEAWLHSLRSTTRTGTRNREEVTTPPTETPHPRPALRLVPAAGHALVNHSRSEAL